MVKCFEITSKNVMIQKMKRLIVNRDTLIKPGLLWLAVPAILTAILVLIWVLKINKGKNEKLINPQVSVSTFPAGTSSALEKNPTISEAKPIPLPALSAGPASEPIKISKTLIENVPFAPQAPFAEWKDERFQDGCEEAASIIAVFWARDLDLTKDKMQEEIIKMAAFQVEKYREARDTSAKDSAQRLIKDYFNFDNFEVKENISLNDIKSELLKGNLVIVPANGQALGNLYFTQPGPERHNLVIRGFDDQKGIFITNDPGIKEGEMYEYPQMVLFSAIRDYPTGYHQPILEDKKVMIVVRKA